MRNTVDFWHFSSKNILGLSKSFDKKGEIKHFKMSIENVDNYLSDNNLDRFT